MSATLSGEDWRNVFLGIIAAMTTIITTIGPLLIARWIEKAKEDRIAAAAIVASKVEEVRTAAAENTDGIKQLQVTATAVHEVVNHRYDEIRAELKLSNENNARMTKLLTQANILTPEQPTSEVVAEPESVEAKRRATDLAALARRGEDKPVELPSAAEVEAGAPDPLEK